MDQNVCSSYGFKYVKIPKKKERKFIDKVMPIVQQDEIEQFLVYDSLFSKRILQIYVNNTSAVKIVPS